MTHTPAPEPVRRYRVYCTTEQDFRYVWSAEPPLTCPTNAAHVLDHTRTTTMSPVQEVYVVGGALETPNALSTSGNLVLSTSGNLVLSTSGNLVLNTSGNLVLNTSGMQMQLNADTGAFGMLKTEIDQPVIQCDFVLGVLPAVVNTSVTGSGTVVSDPPLAVLSTGAAANSTAKVVTRRYMRYRPGQGANVMFTAVFTPGAAGSRQIIGVGSDTNGLFVGYNNTQFGLLHRNQGADTWIYQNTWNVDKMDGAGPTGQLLDTTKGNVFRITYQWLGFGMLTLMIEDSETGKFMPVHRIKYANKNTIPSLGNPSGPMRAEVYNTSNTSNIVLRTPCLAAMSEGQQRFLGGAVWSTDTTRTVTGSAAKVNVMSLRSPATFKGVAHFIPVLIRTLNIGTDGNKNAVIYLIRGATIDGVMSWSSVASDQSVVEVGVSSSGGGVTGGVQLAAFPVGKAESRAIPLFDMFDLVVDPGEVLTVAARLTTGTGSTEVTAALTWIEDV